MADRRVMHLAQFNISREKASLDDPSMRDFIDSLDPINKLADRSKGFVWRLHDESGNATSIRAFDDRSIIFNLSVWQSVESLQQFVYHSQHAGVLKRRQEWFMPMSEHAYVLWWIPETHRPSIEEAKARLRHLQQNDETPYAFTFTQMYASKSGHG